MSSHQYVYVMHRLSKAWPGGKEVLKNISLSFLPGAKIGVLGLNGAGKSTLLKIMAGLDTEFNGEAWAADGIKVGYLAQEPELDASMDVAGNVLSGLGEAKELMDRFNEVSARFAEELTPSTAGTSSARPRSPWTRFACRRAMPMSPSCPAARSAGSRCASCC